MTRPSPLHSFLLGAAGIVAASWVGAQDVQEAGTEVRGPRSVQMSEEMYRQLSALHELLGEDQTDEVLTRLEALRRQNLNAYEEALIYQTEGISHAQAGNYALAIAAFRRCVELDALSNLAQQSTLYSLAGLLTGEGQFEEAISTMLTWLRFAQEPVAADAYMLIGSSYSEMAELDAALPYVQEAISRAEVPNESWYRLELSIHVERSDYESVVGLLRQMVVLWPDNARYWEMLASAYTELEEDSSALATLTVAYKRGLVTEQSRLLDLARLNLFLDIPYEAGRLLETEIGNGRVASSQETLGLLLSAWTVAREFDKALSVIDALAALSDDGADYLRKARLLTEQEDWPGVVDATEQALERGGIEREGDAWILKGMAHAELEQYDRALAAFEEASRLGDDAQRNARAWIGYVRDRRQAAVTRP